MPHCENNIIAELYSFFIFCEITLKVYEHFLCYTDKILNIGPVDLIERAFGLREEEDNEKRIKLRNYVNFTVRHIIFRNRNRNLGASDATVVTNICKKVVSFIQKDLNLKFSRISLSGRASFVENYLIDGVLGKIEDDKLVLNYIT